MVALNSFEWEGKKGFVTKAQGQQPRENVTNPETNFVLNFLLKC